MTVDVLNLYAGIGGNRKLWDEVADIDVTAVEIDPDIAQVYQEHFPGDRVIVADAHEYLRANYETYDFIWSSPPCETHSRMKLLSAKSNVKQNKSREADYPDMDLYEEIILLRSYFDGDWVVENVIPYYEPLIEPQKVDRHYVWSNFFIPNREFESGGIVDITCTETKADYQRRWREITGFNITDCSFDSVSKSKVRKNTINPELGKHVFSQYNSGKPEWWD